jgi:hypothetical protein
MATIETSYSTPIRRRVKRQSQLLGATALLLLSLASSPGLAQGAGLQPGEAFATRFSGVMSGRDGRMWIDPRGTVGSILDLRAPRQPAQGQHWINEPQRAPITADQIGQVFGVAFDDAVPPNIYVTATAAFGLHRTPDNSQWMPGMFGAGGPGAIYRLDAANGYQPRLFATVTLEGRPNSGAALGNITYDRWHKQFLVSDLETGMIHRINLKGQDLGGYDHGTQGRANFVDAQSGRQQSLAPIAFEAASAAHIADCGAQFDTTPECWNVAASNRRVWGLGVWRGPGGETRLYYSVASSPDLGNDAWHNLGEDEKRNSLWSVRLTSGGAFDLTGVRREFNLPDFFTAPEDVARAGYSRPVSDITFPACSGRAVMLVAERGGLRNLGLGQENAFATPSESRTIRYELDQAGRWQVAGRYDVGMYDRSQEGPPYVNANCAGGVTFGPGYTQDGMASANQPDQSVWMSGDKLCSPQGPCNAMTGQSPRQQAVRQVSVQNGADNYQPDYSEVHGVQGQPEEMYNALVPETATGDKPATPATLLGPHHAYMVDIEVNIDQAGNVIPETIARNDATTIGDISIYQICPIENASYSTNYPLIPAQVTYDGGVGGGFVEIIHDRGISHYRWWSEGHWRQLSPYHSRSLSPTHWRYESPGHWRILSPSHQRDLSPTHNRRLSPEHLRHLSPTHLRDLSPTHLRSLSPIHLRTLSPTHTRLLSPIHKRELSPGHSRDLSPGHDRLLSPIHRRELSPGHSRELSPGHNRQLSPGHSTALSPGHIRILSPGPVHVRPLSPAVPHNRIQSNPSTHLLKLSTGTPIDLRTPQGSRTAHLLTLSRTSNDVPRLRTLDPKKDHTPRLNRVGNLNPNPGLNRTRNISRSISTVGQGASNKPTFSRTQSVGLHSMGVRSLGSPRR